VDAALEVSPPTPKRKAARPPKETSNPSGEPEFGHRAKRTRRSTGGPTTPVKSQRDERAEERSANKFDGVVLPTRRKSARYSPRKPIHDEETSSSKVLNDNDADAGSEGGTSSD
jgi:hypothetical protein